MDNKDFCEVNCIHQDVVDRVKRNMISEEEIRELVDIFKILGNATRLRILQLLMQAEMCVCDLSAALEMNQPAVSHQLRLLRTSRLVKNRQQGKVVYYSLDDEHVETLLGEGLKHIRHI